METRSSILDKLASAKRLAVELAKGNPDEEIWQILFAMLLDYENKINDHWPLTLEEKEKCLIGWFSVRNIEDIYPQLDEALCDVSYSIRHSGD